MSRRINWLAVAILMAAASAGPLVAGGNASPRSIAAWRRSFRQVAWPAWPRA